MSNWTFGLPSVNKVTTPRKAKYTDEAVLIVNPMKGNRGTFKLSTHAVKEMNLDVENSTVDSRVTLIPLFNEGMIALAPNLPGLWVKKGRTFSNKEFHTIVTETFEFDNTIENILSLSPQNILRNGESFTIFVLKTYSKEEVPQVSGNIVEDTTDNIDFSVDSSDFLPELEGQSPVNLEEVEDTTEISVNNYLHG